MTRPSWDRYFVAVAQAAATRATCRRAQVGCVLVGAGRDILATGFNGALSGDAHCLDVGCEIGPHGGCTRCQHAEANAVARAAYRGTSIGGATAYVTLSPCRDCARLLYAAGVRDIVYATEYRDTAHLWALARLGMRFRQG